MEKIIQKALSLAGFQNADEITRVISATPNPRVAAEIVLGVYTPTTIDQGNRYRKHKYDNYIAEVISIDELNDSVEFVLHKQKTKTVYYLTKEDRDNKKFVEERPKDWYDSSRVPTNGYELSSEVTRMENFNDYYSKTMTVEEACTILQEWEEYGLPPVTEEYLNELPFWLVSLYREICGGFFVL